MEPDFKSRSLEYGVSLALACQYFHENKQDNEPDLEKLHKTPANSESDLFSRLRYLGKAIVNGERETCDDISDSTTGKLTKSLFPDKKPLALLNFDTDSVKEYVYASSKLPEISGSSEILKELNINAPLEALRKYGLTCDCIIYAGGGNGLLIIPRYLAEDIKNFIEVYYLDNTLIQTVTCAFIEIEPLELIYGKNAGSDSFKKLKTLSFPAGWKIYSEDITKLRDRKGFGELVNFLGEKMGETKHNRCKIPFYECIPLARNCSSCGIRPAVISAGLPERNEYFCRPCNIKREKGKSEIIEGKTLEYIADENKYIGIIYADGNKMNSLFSEIRSLREYKILSEEVEMAFIYETDKLIKELLKKYGYGPVEYEINEKLKDKFKEEFPDIERLKNGKFKQAELEKYIEKLSSNPVKRAEILDHAARHRFISLVMGGDDLIIILPAKCCLEIAKEIALHIENYFSRDTLLNKFTNKDVRNKVKDIGIGIGIIIAHHTFPVLYLIQYAENLLKEAKKKSYRDASIKSTVDFIIMSQASPLTDSIENWRDEFYRKEDRIFIQRPYSLTEFDKFITHVKTLKGKELMSQLHMLKDIVFREKEEGCLDFMYQVARNVKLQNWLEEIEVDWKQPEEIRKFLWRKDNNSTPVLDYIEAMEFIR